MFQRRRRHFRRRWGIRRWRRPFGCWWLLGGLIGMIVLLALARVAFRLF
jgi:hypothetical protein